MLHLLHLDESDVREQMVGGWTDEREELRAKGAQRDCYGRDLTDLGWSRFEEAMPEALLHHDDDWLMRALDDPFNWQASRWQRGGGGGSRRLQVNWHEAVSRLAVGEFNTAYVRGLARALLLRGEREALVYRAGPAAEPRGECSSWEGRRVSLQQVLDGHRARYWPPPGRPGAWSVPSGPNCHHSIRAVPRPG